MDPSKPQAMSATQQMTKQNLASQIIVQDHMKQILMKSENKNYRPWDSKFCPKNPHSPFGDFPKEYM